MKKIPKEIEESPQLNRPSHNGPSNNEQAVKLCDLDVNKLEISPILKEGSVGDRFLEIKYNGNLLLVRFDDLPNFRNWPFNVGPAMKNGMPLGEAWSGVVELTGAEYDKAMSIEQHIIETLKPRCQELMGHTLKKDKAGKPIDKYSERTFEAADFNSQIKPADVEKGYPANFRIGVQHDAFGKDGKPRTMPRIYLTKWKGPNSWTKPKVGKVEDLSRNCAVCAVVQVFRGYRTCHLNPLSTSRTQTVDP